jgi:hypothetical protein
LQSGIKDRFGLKKFKIKKLRPYDEALKKFFVIAVGFNPNHPPSANHTPRPGYHGSSPERLTGR